MFWVTKSWKAMTKSWNGMENGITNGIAGFNFVEKHYFTIADLFCRYKLLRVIITRTLPISTTCDNALEA